MTRSERQRIAAAIDAAEDGTTGRIAVRVIPDATVDAFERAKVEFLQIGLHRHKNANAALILVAPKAHRFAVIGDRVLHERMGDSFWNEVIADSTPYFAGGEISDGIVYAVGRVGEALHTHFANPAEPAS